MKKLQTYALQRGVILYLEFDLPGHVYSWRYADERIVANCPSKTNINNWAINPVYEKSYEYIKGVLEETLIDFFSNSGITPMIHLGGDEVVGACWEEDAEVKQYMDEHNITSSELWKEFHDKVYKIID